MQLLLVERKRSHMHWNCRYPAAFPKGWACWVTLLHTILEMMQHVLTLEETKHALKDAPDAAPCFIVNVKSVPISFLHHVRNGHCAQNIPHDPLQEALASPTLEMYRM